jgi:hypothetical protein
MWSIMAARVVVLPDPVGPVLGQRVGEVDLTDALEFLGQVGADDGLDDPVDGVRGERRGFQAVEIAVDPDPRRRAGLHVQV